ncbi:hypothetical protein FS837_002884 [Tulasnella sp. UAMH 9824]|nr:hypothetical protein FS837_002884 [Tulasnella sp. UAMH 9824]
MSSAPQVERFKGTGWEECDEFISAIRARALWEGKQRDSAWKADFATPLFSGKALSWHSRLPEDVREDWSKLEIALLDRWPPSDDHEKPQIQPTPAAAAPSQDRDDKANHRIQSVLKVVLDEFNKAYYLKSFGEWCDLTSDRNEALRVGCNSLSSATQLERIDDPRHSWLAVQWQFHTRVIGKGSTYFGKVTLIDSDTLKSSWHNSEPFQVNIWTVLPNGEVIPVWKKDDKTAMGRAVAISTSPPMQKPMLKKMTTLKERYRTYHAATILKLIFFLPEILPRARGY